MFVVTLEGPRFGADGWVDTRTQFEAIYREHFGSVYRYAAMLVADPSDAADLTSETFERAYRAWSTGRPPSGPVLPWLLLIARRISVDRWRQIRVWLSARGRLASVAADDRAETESRLWLEAIAGALPRRQREVLVLRYLGELSDVEIGALMQLTPSGVRSLAARAVQSLRDRPEVWR
jgi:RNA polymerase sigma factor (sigma-70 family)